MTRLLRSTLALALVAGCGGPTIQNRPDGAISDAAPVPTDRTLAFASSDALQLEPGMRADIVVTLRDDRSGLPVVGEPVHFALVRGDPRDATLADTTVSTGASDQTAGIARTTLVASSEATTFQIRASANRASDVYLNVAVSARGFGAISVTETYSGHRQPQSIRLDLFESRTCAQLDASVEPVRSVSLPATGGIATFGSLPAGEPFAIRAMGLGTGLVVLASGCLDEVVFGRDQTAQRAVPFTDRPLRAMGVYRLTMHLDLGRAPLEAVVAWSTAMNDEVSTHGTEADYLLDAIATAVGAPHTPARDAFDSTRDLLRTRVTGLYVTAGTSPLQTLLRLAANAGAASQALTVRATATARPGIGEIADFDLSSGSMNIDPLTPDVQADDLTTALTLTGSGHIATSSTDRAAGVITGMSLSFPTVARASVRALLTRLGAGTATEWASLAGRCAEIGDLAAPYTGGACGADCVAMACRGAAAQLARVFDNAIDTQDSQHAAVSLAFEGSVTGIPSTLYIDRLSDAPAVGSFDDDATSRVFGTVAWALQVAR